MTRSTILSIAVAGWSSLFFPLPVLSDPSVPPQFGIDHITNGIAYPIAISFTPDGRALISEKNLGQIRVIKDDVLLPTPFADVHVNWAQERGGLGIAVDPDFAQNGYVYMFYTLSSTNGDTGVTDSVVHNRVVRFTASGDTAMAGSETLLHVFPLVPESGFHNAGNLHFAPDDTLIVAVGDGQFNPSPALDLGNPRGKLHRLDPTTGLAAPGNQFARDGNPGTLSTIHSYGHRNPFDFTFHPVTGEIFCTENGLDEDDEVNHILEAANYGWPEVVGVVDTPAESIYAAAHSDYRDPIWVSGVPTICPTGVVVVNSESAWGQVLGECLLIGECKPPFRILRLPLGGAARDSVTGPLEVFAQGFSFRVIDLEFDDQDRLWVTTFPDIWRIDLDEIVSVETSPQVSLWLRLAGANPARGSVELRFGISDRSPADLRIVDARGALVRVLERRFSEPGRHQSAWDGRDRSGRAVPSGVYFAVLDQGHERRVVEFVFMR